MPTPFYHLHIARDLTAFSDLLRQQRSAFFLGNTAPDVQTISGQKRPETHFFHVPMIDSTPAWEKLLCEHPALAEAHSLPPAQAAFIAGYLCHLQADHLWVREIFLPYFGRRAGWGRFKRRMVLHNVLRTYLDQQILAELPPETAETLAAARPQAWLPFAEDQYLREWRDLLVEQLLPGNQSQTVEVFAARMGVPVEDFNGLLASEERLETEIFAHIPRRLLVEYRQRLLQENQALLKAYFGKN